MPSHPCLVSLLKQNVHPSMAPQLLTEENKGEQENLPLLMKESRGKKTTKTYFSIRNRF